MLSKVKKVVDSKHKIFLPVFLALAIFTVAILATKVKAQEAVNYPPIVQKIADKFNLNVSEVAGVFDEERDERRAEMFAYFAEHLNDLVAEGKLTEEQKEAVLDKHEELQSSMEGLGGLSREERKAKMLEVHNSFKSWAEEQGIDLSSIGPFKFGFHQKGGDGSGFHHKYMMNLE